MIGTVDHTTVSFLGAIVGTVSISIAVYFQMVYQHSCPPKYVLGFLSFGVIMLLMNADPAVRHGQAHLLEALAYVILTCFEFVIAIFIQTRLSEYSDGLHLMDAVEKVK